MQMKNEFTWILDNFWKEILFVIVVLTTNF